ncbi:MAG: hypothetical protein RL318_1732 [Fibrobacterota bacterium]|jgi:hypothetical protein
MKMPSRFFLALLSILVLGWKIGTVERWRSAFGQGTGIHALLTDPVKALPVLDTSVASVDTTPLPDPFGSVPLPEPTSAPVSKAAPAVLHGPRPWKLVGLVGTRSAILASGARTWVVGSGERIDSIRVVSISGTGVTLEDGAGQWTLATSR